MLKKFWNKVLTSCTRSQELSQDIGDAEDSDEFGGHYDKDQDQDQQNAGDCANVPLPYHGYRPNLCTPLVDLPVHYWFYVYVYSSDCDRLLTPFCQLRGEGPPADRRLVGIMNRSKARIFLNGLELYKSLPRYIMVVQGITWKAVIRALIELEDSFPELMKFATHPMLMNASTCRFAHAGYNQSALQTRLTG